MSNMLKQAILDAEALREVALKNAEAALLEKYSGQIKEAVEQLLEQPEDPLAPEQAPADDVMNMSAEPQVDNIDSVLDQVPMASTDGEKACPCPDENQTITLKLDQLEKAVNEAQRAQIDQLTENELFEALENEDVLAEKISKLAKPGDFVVLFTFISSTAGEKYVQRSVLVKIKDSHTAT